MTFMKQLADILSKSISSAGRELERIAQHRIEVQVRRAQRFIFKQAFMIIFFALASLCLFMALVFAGIEYLQFTKTLSFLIVGVLALFIGLIIKALS